MRDIKQETEDIALMKNRRRAFRTGIVALVLAAGAVGAVYLYLHNPRDNKFFPCIIYQFTGFYCPGCGAGRACYSILHGEWYQAFRYNPLLLILLPWLGLYIALWAGDWALNGKHRIDDIVPFRLVYIILIIVLAYGVLRNIPVYPFTLLQPQEIL